jgi:hypothetical protein
VGLFEASPTVMVPLPTSCRLARHGQRIIPTRLRVVDRQGFDAILLGYRYYALGLTRACQFSVAAPLMIPSVRFGDRRSRLLNGPFKVLAR